MFRLATLELLSVLCLVMELALIKSVLLGMIFLVFFSVDELGKLANNGASVTSTAANAYELAL